MNILIYYTNIAKRGRNKVLLFLFFMNIVLLVYRIVRLYTLLKTLQILNIEKLIIRNPSPIAASILTGLLKNYLHMLILWKFLLKIVPQFPPLFIHGIYQCIDYKLLIHSYTGIHMMLFFLPESYFFILGFYLPLTYLYLGIS